MSTTELSYQYIVNSTDNHPTPFLEELDGDVAPAWTLDSTSPLDCLETVLPYEEAILEAIQDVFAWSYEEMPGIDPSILVHEIPTYSSAKPVR